MSSNRNVERIHTQELKDRSTHESCQVPTESFLREKNSDLSSVYERAAPQSAQRLPGTQIRKDGISIQMKLTKI
jgi:hypothetical protein